MPAIGLGAAIDYLNDDRPGNDSRHERCLTVRAHEVLEAFGGVRLLGPAPEDKAGIVSFTLEGMHAHDMAQLLDRQGDRRPRRASLRHAAAQAAGHQRPAPAPASTSTTRWPKSSSSARRSRTPSASFARSSVLRPATEAPRQLRQVAPSTSASRDRCAAISA